MLKTRSLVEPCPAVRRRYVLKHLTMNGAVAGTGRPIVFIHGLGWDHSLWGGAMSRLCGQYLTIAGDTRGHGDTDKPEGPYSVGGFAQDWAELIATVASEPALVVGFSLGGMIAQTLALDYPALVGGLVLVNTSCRSPSVGRAHMSDRLSAIKRDGPAAGAMLAARSVFSPAWLDAHPSQLAEFVDWRVGQDQRALAEAMRAASDFDVCGRLGTLDIPALVVTSLGDKLMLPADQAPLKDLIPGAEYAEIPDSGHMVPIEQPEAFESVLQAFLQRHWPAEGGEER